MILRVLFFSSTAHGETALILPESFLFFLFRMLEQQTFGLQLFHYILVKSSTILMASSTETPTLPPPPLGSVLWSPDHCFLVSSSAEDWKDECDEIIIEIGFRANTNWIHSAVNGEWSEKSKIRFIRSIEFFSRNLNFAKHCWRISLVCDSFLDLC